MKFISELNGIEEETIYNDLTLHSLNGLKSMEVIDIKEGVKLGFVKDFVIDIKESKVVAIILPSIGKGWFSKEEDIEIPWERVKKAGIDVLLVDTDGLENENFENSI
ncbi:YlmC/YmxH family sporulation protein [Clostridium sp.]|uniref:YlmC/YmxH family sporulation protein n=1 Tax=Clostridium sp. TaxID=1506 RepID=UPI003F4159C7